MFAHQETHGLFPGLEQNLVAVFVEVDEVLDWIPEKAKAFHGDICGARHHLAFFVELVPGGSVHSFSGVVSDLVVLEVGVTNPW